MALLSGMIDGNTPPVVGPYCLHLVVSVHLPLDVTAGTSGIG